MDVIPETRDWSPLVRAFRTGNQVELTVDWQTDGWYDDEFGYCRCDCSHVEPVFGGTEMMADAGSDDGGWLHVATTAPVEAGTPQQASVPFRLDNIAPFGWTFDISVALLDSAGGLTGGAGSTCCPAPPARTRRAGVSAPMHSCSATRRRWGRSTVSSASTRAWT